MTKKKSKKVKIGHDLEKSVNHGGCTMKKRPRMAQLLTLKNACQVFWNEDGPFRVNAIKNERCEWVEFPSGKRVPFHHFPDFDQNSGRPGDTLVWYPKSNKLSVENADKIFNVLCYRPKQGSESLIFLQSRCLLNHTDRSINIERENVHVLTRTR